jgi:Flp pilus assembly protein TadG
MFRALSCSYFAARVTDRCALPRLRRDTSGVSAIEFAILAPVFMTLVIGLFKFGIAISQYLALTNGVGQGALVFGLSRGTTTPYTTATTAVTSGAANLTAASVTITLKINGTACTSDSTCSAALVAGATALVKATYPCDLSVMGVDYMSGGCTLTAQSAQIVQ